MNYQPNPVSRDTCWFDFVYSHLRSRVSRRMDASGYPGGLFAEQTNLGDQTFAGG